MALSPEWVALKIGQSGSEVPEYSPDNFLIPLLSYQISIFRLEIICILDMSLLLKNSIVIHAIQTKYSKYIRKLSNREPKSIGTTKAITSLVPII